MINTVFAYDEGDPDMGSYFSESYKDIISDLNQNQLVQTITLASEHCTEVHLQNHLAAINGNSFVFVAITHGNEDEFFSDEVFISARNANQLKNAFIYSTACSTGKNLAQTLIDNGSCAFIGYSDRIYVPLDLSNMFYTCENHGIKTFLNNVKTIEDSYYSLRDKYNEQIDILYEGGMEELITASTLVANRDKLMILGNKALTRDDFNSQ